MRGVGSSCPAAHSFRRQPRLPRRLDSTRRERQRSVVGRFWFLDRRHTGLHDFYHFVGYVDAPIPLPPSPVQDFVGAVSIAPPQDGGGALYVNMAWEVEQAVSSGKHLYRARLTNAQLDDAKIIARRASCPTTLLPEPG